MRFFKWLYNPDIEANKRPKPAAIENIPQLIRRKNPFTNQVIYGPDKTTFCF